MTFKRRRVIGNFELNKVYLMFWGVTDLTENIPFIFISIYLLDFSNELGIGFLYSTQLASVFHSISFVKSFLVFALSDPSSFIQHGMVSLWVWLM